VQILLGQALQVETRDPRRPHREERESAFVQAVHQLVRGGRRLGENTEPRERVGALVDAHLIWRDRSTRDPVRAVTAGNEIALDRVVLAIVREPDGRLLFRQA
jgi:hypothetical protein